MSQRLVFFFMIFSLSRASEAQTEFNKPWEDPSRALLIDSYHGNHIDFDSLTMDKRIKALIHKASQGMDKDTLFHRRRREAKRHGLLFGSYHLGMKGDPEGQAKFYLDVVGRNGDLLALDLEGVDTSRYMSLDEAERFVKVIHDKTGRYPLVYMNHKLLVLAVENYDKTSILAKCPLWYARFRPEIVDFPKGIWNTYTIWQFSSEINCDMKGTCLYNVPGTRYDIDVNVFNGTAAQLRRLFAGGQRSAPGASDDAGKEEDRPAPEDH